MEHKGECMKIIIALLLSVMLVSCAHEQTINGQIYEPKGIVTMDEKDSNIKYRLCVGNVVWACVLSGTIVAPVVICGWYLWEPAYALSSNK